MVPETQAPSLVHLDIVLLSTILLVSWTVISMPAPMWFLPHSIHHDPLSLSLLVHTTKPLLMHQIDSSGLRLSLQTQRLATIVPMPNAMRQHFGGGMR